MYDVFACYLQFTELLLASHVQTMVLDRLRLVKAGAPLVTTQIAYGSGICQVKDNTVWSIKDLQTLHTCCRLCIIISINSICLLSSVCRPTCTQHTPHACSTPHVHAAHPACMQHTPHACNSPHLHPAHSTCTHLHPAHPTCAQHTPHTTNTPHLQPTHPTYN
jgi:hypothetical protein